MAGTCAEHDNKLAAFIKRSLRFSQATAGRVTGRVAGWGEPGAEPGGEPGAAEAGDCRGRALHWDPTVSKEGPWPAIVVAEG